MATAVGDADPIGVPLDPTAGLAEGVVVLDAVEAVLDAVVGVDDDFPPQAARNALAAAKDDRLMK